jgi:hypothetical protein
MTRLSDNIIQEFGGVKVIRDGFNYDLQVWVINFIIQDSNSARDKGIVGKDILDYTR